MGSKIVSILVLLLCSFSFSQLKTTKYYIEFKSQNTKPKFARTTNDRVILINSRNTQSIVKSIKKDLEIFKNEKLKNTDIIEFVTEQDFYNFLSTNRTEIINYERIQEEVSKDNLLYTPNDYYLSGNPEGYNYLEVINAKEAWNYAKGDNIIVGIPDSGFRPTHIEFQGKMNFMPNEVPSNGEHGNWVSGLAGAKTDNNFANSSIGFNNKLLVSNNWSLSNLKKMSDLGAKVINMSWLDSCSPYQYYQLALNEIYQQGTVLVAAAGNHSTCGGPLKKVYPASYDNVISVSGVGHLNDLNSGNSFNVKDVHYRNYATMENTTHHNEAVDMVAPAYGFSDLPGQYSDDSKTYVWTGTSFSAPLVSGTISLMFSANSCLSPNEVESILKMTSVNIDQIIYNQPFTGLLGAGRLDAGKATKISKQMTLNEELLFQDKNFNRWNFELLNSPYKIKFINYKFTDNSSTKFKAKNSIILDNGVEFKPNNSTSHKLWIDNSTTCFIPKNTPSIARKNQIIEDYESIEKKYEVIDVSIYPTLVKDKISIKSGFERDDIASLTITDLNGKEILQEKIDFQNLKDIYVNNLQKGIYFVTLKNEFLNINTKIIKN